VPLSVGAGTVEHNAADYQNCQADSQQWKREKQITGLAGMRRDSPRQQDHNGSSLWPPCSQPKHAGILHSNGPIGGLADSRTYHDFLACRLSYMALRGEADNATQTARTTSGALELLLASPTAPFGPQ
jgi:hypothetical protein